jgi:glycine/D-amino acid oxidase-like deaminating enzyme
MSVANHDVFVIGAGVCGLSVALVLLDAGLAVTVYAAEPPRGGTVTVGKPLKSLAEAEQLAAGPVIVNCSGTGARELADDDALIPVRGQVVVVANPGLTEFFVGENAQSGQISYIFPHGPTVVLGGTEQSGNASTQADPATASQILRTCAAIEPRAGRRCRAGPSRRPATGKTPGQAGHRATARRPPGRARLRPWRRRRHLVLGLRSVGA